MKEIVLATGNLGKVREFQRFFENLSFRIIPQSEFQVPPIEEIGSTFVENAIIKARHASQYAHLPAIADDSGLEVDALEGAPGIRSARYAGNDANDSDNIQKLLQALKDIPFEKRTARFQCVLVFLQHHEDSNPLIVQGTWEGFILLAPQGDQGFGYDPVFFVPTHQCSAAELPPLEKNRISHRGQAMQKLAAALSQEK